MDNSGEIIEEKIPAYYCEQCDKYYILQSDYEGLEKNYVLLCKVIDGDKLNKRPNDGSIFNSFNKESVMMQYGYSVSAQKGLSERRRRQILGFIMDGRILSRAEVCSHLDWLIDSHFENPKYELAVSKWESDRAFVEGYTINDLPEVIVRSLKLKNKYKG